MPRSATILAALFLFALPATSQTSATATVRQPCINAAPPTSMLARKTNPLTFLPDSRGVVTIECETIGPIGDWRAETSAAGFGGSSYLRWNGPNLFGTPGRDTLTFRFRVKQSGNHLIRVHVRHDNADSSEENDCWARFENGPWEKLFHNTGSGGVGVWTFAPIYESTHQFPQYNMQPGRDYEFQISGRSKNFKIDQVHIVPGNVWFADVDDPESQPRRMRPRMGTNFKMEVGDPANASNLNPATTTTVVYAGLPAPGYPCGVPTSIGEFLIGSAPLEKSGRPVPWNGPGSPAIHTVLIPSGPSFLGLSFSAQGALFDMSTGRIVLTDALDLVIGDI